jgi:hypothetical protein
MIVSSYRMLLHLLSNIVDFDPILKLEETIVGHE